MKSAEDGVKNPYTGGVNNRRIRARARLEAQLKSGVKPNPDVKAGNDVNVPLEDRDVNRIQKEIKVLTSKIK